MSWNGGGGRRPGTLSLFGRDLSVAFIGHLVSKGIGSLTFVLMTRTLSPDAYGLFTLALSVYEIALNLSELGLNTAITRFVSKGIRDRDQARTDGVLRAAFFAKLTLALVTLAVGIVTAPVIAGFVLRRPEMTPYLRIAFVGLVGMHLQGFYLSAFGARLEFGRGAVFSALAPAVIFTGVAAAWWWGRLDVRVCLILYSFVPLGVCALAVWLLPHGFLRHRQPGLAALRQLWGFSRWVYATDVLGSVRFRLNSILLSRLATLDQVGLYSYGDKLASILTLFTSTILTVFIPRASHLVSQDELREFLRRSYRWMALLFPVLVLLPLGSRTLISILAPRYAAASPIFALLFISVLFSLASLPSRTVLYSIHRPEVETAIEVVALALVVVVGYLLVRSHAGLGAAVAMLAQRLVSAVLAVGWVHRAVFHGTVEPASRAHRAAP